jgi:hypothetical protein
MRSIVRSINPRMFIILAAALPQAQQGLAQGQTDDTRQTELENPLLGDFHPAPYRKNRRLYASTALHAGSTGSTLENSSLPIDPAMWLQSAWSAATSNQLKIYGDYSNVKLSSSMARYLGGGTQIGLSSLRKVMQWENHEFYLGLSYRFTEFTNELAPRYRTGSKWQARGNHHDVTLFAEYDRPIFDALSLFFALGPQLQRRMMTLRSAHDYISDDYSSGITYGAEARSGLTYSYKMQQHTFLMRTTLAYQLGKELKSYALNYSDEVVNTNSSAYSYGVSAGYLF